MRERRVLRLRRWWIGLCICLHKMIRAQALSAQVTRQRQWAMPMGSDWASGTDRQTDKRHKKQAFGSGKAAFSEEKDQMTCYGLQSDKTELFCSEYK